MKRPVAFVNEFKEFIMRGNIVDLAVGVVVGGAFGKITTSLINDVVMPPIGKLLGNVDFKELKIIIQEGVATPKTVGDVTTIEKVGEVAIRYGMFINTLIDFMIIAFVIFMVVKAVNKMKRKQAAEPEVIPEPTKEELLLIEIRDLLKEQRK
jgi:large conductance mechanosensitive channel